MTAWRAWGIIFLLHSQELYLIGLVLRGLHHSYVYRISIFLCLIISFFKIILYFFWPLFAFFHEEVFFNTTILTYQKIKKERTHKSQHASMLKTLGIISNQLHLFLSTLSTNIYEAFLFLAVSGTPSLISRLKRNLIKKLTCT